MINSNHETANDIILVADTENKAALAIRIVVDTDFSVISAFNLEDASEALSQRPEKIKLVFINSNIGNNAWESLLLKLKTNYPNIKTILVSDNTEAQEIAVNAGVDGLYKKPSIIDAEGIQSEINRVLELV